MQPVCNNEWSWWRWLKMNDIDDWVFKKRLFLTKPELCRWMTRKAGLLKSVLHEVDKNLRGYDATLYDLFKYPFVSYDVDACKNGSSARKQNIHDFLLVLSLVLLKTLFFQKLMYSLCIGKIQNENDFQCRIVMSIGWQCTMFENHPKYPILIFGILAFFHQFLSF